MTTPEPLPAPVRPRKRRRSAEANGRGDGYEAPLVDLPAAPAPSSSSADKLAPQSVAAEQSVLGSILIDPNALERVIGILEPASFYRNEHALIYSAMVELHRHAMAIDLLTLTEELRRVKLLDQVGGPAYLTHVMNAVPTAMHVEHYARTVAMKALARRAIADAGRIAAMGYEDSNNPEELLTRLRTTVDGIVESWVAGVRDVPSPALPDIYPPEHPDLYLIERLIRPGTTVMLAGPPGAAKSWAARQLILTAASGRPSFLDRYEIDRPMRCLVVDEDNGPDEEWRRETALLEHIEVERSALPNVRRVSLEGVQLDQDQWQRWLRGQIRTYELDLVVLDPISEFHGGKELREDPSLRSVLAFLKRLKVDFPRLATIVVHHTRKLDAKDRTAHRGLEDVRGQWGQTPDVVVVMSPLGERRTKWEVHKRVPFSSLILEQIEQGHPGQGALRMVADETVMQSRAMANDGAVIDALRGGFSLFPDIQQALGMPKSTLSNVLNRLIRAGVVKKSGREYSAPEDD